MLVNSSRLRLIWAVVEEIPPSDLLTFPDTALVKLLLQHVTQKVLLNGEEVCALYGYLGSKVTLIRDIAESRLAQETKLLERSFIAAQTCGVPSLESAETLGAPA